MRTRRVATSKQCFKEALFLILVDLFFWLKQAAYSFAMSSSTMSVSPASSITRRRKRSNKDRQAEKSQQTQTLILEAALQCLVTRGYAGTTTDWIVKVAGVSRGALTHHFKSRSALINATAKYVTEKRAVEFDQMMSGIEVPAGELPTLAHMQMTISALQHYYHQPSFYALHELLRSARTEKALKKVLAPLEEQLDRRMSDDLLRRFPYWKVIDETREVLMDLVTFSLQGVAVDLVPYLEGERQRHFNDLLASIVMREFTEAYVASGRLAPKRGSK